MSIDDLTNFVFSAFIVKKCICKIYHRTLYHHKIVGFSSMYLDFVDRFKKYEIFFNFTSQSTCALAHPPFT